MTILHEQYMRVALSLARRQAGRTWPNPNVGAVIVKDGQIIATGITANGGRPHAETIAIEHADDLAKDATLYVTLEPCSHHGKTPPCVDAIIAAGINKVVVACRDKNPLVSGKGIAALKNAGIEVIENICQKEALEINQGFFSVIEKKRPFIALKIATSQDYKINDPTERWLTGEHARTYGHLLRSQYDAILTGSGTVIADDPELTCRLDGLKHHSPVRIVLDRNNQIPKTAKIFREQDIAPTWVIHEKTITDVLKTLTDKGITSILVEAGKKLTEEFLASGLVDTLYHFRAPMIIGDKGLPILLNLDNFKHIEHITLGNDSLEIYTCSQVS